MVYRSASKSLLHKLNVIHHAVIWFVTGSSCKKHTTVICTPWKTGHCFILTNKITGYVYLQNPQWKTPGYLPTGTSHCSSIAHSKHITILVSAADDRNQLDSLISLSFFKRSTRFTVLAFSCIFPLLFYHCFLTFCVVLLPLTRLTL